MAGCTLRLRILARLHSPMIYKGYVIDVSEREPARWIARISRVDGKNIRAGHGWQNAFYDNIAPSTSARYQGSRHAPRRAFSSPELCHNQTDALSGVWGSLFVCSGVNRLKLAWKILRLRHVSLSGERVPENFATLSVGQLVSYP